MVQEHVSRGYAEGYRVLTIITGKSGQINIELPKWLEKNSRVRSVTPKNGGGAWEVCLKKRNM